MTANVRIAASLLLNTAIVGWLAVLMVAGPAGARFGGLAGLAGFAPGVAAAVRRDRLEHAEDPAPRGRRQLLAGLTDVPFGGVAFFVASTVLNRRLV